jgi:hypothetical protein
VNPRAKFRLEGLGQLKQAMNSSAIEPATFQLKQLRYRRSGVYIVPEE